MTRLPRFFAVTLLLIAFGRAQGGILVQDDFNDNSLDTSKWTIDTNILRGPASVTEQNQRIEIRNRGHLITVDQFDPLDVPVLQVTGTWTVLDATLPDHDNTAVLTRSDGVPDGAFSETKNGIEFQLISAGVGSLRIQSNVNGVLTLLASAPLTGFDSGDVFDFLIQDDGTNLFFSVQEVGGDGTAATVAATSSLDFALDHVVFHNREANNGGQPLAYLDNVTISAVPEPSAFGLGLLGLLTLSWRVCRRRRIHRCLRLPLAA